MKSMKLSDYYKVIKPDYKYIKITTHKSIRNYNTTTIAKTVAQTYKSLEQRMYRENKKLIVEAKFKISYVIDIEKMNVNFYFIVPGLYLSAMLNKIREIWSKATVEIIDKIKPLSDSATTYSLSYKKDDALSLYVNKKTNEPLTQILSVVEDMLENDRVTLIYNFQPTNIDWQGRYETTMSKIKSGKSIEKVSLSTKEKIKKTFMNILIGALNVTVNILDGFLGISHKKDENVIKNILGFMEEQKELSTLTKSKKDSSIIKTQIAVVSYSDNKIKQDTNAISVCQSFNSIAGDNELVYKKEKNKKGINFEQCDLKLPRNLCSTEEIKNFIQLPGRNLVEEHKIEYIKTQETLVPEELREGTKKLGTTAYKGTTQDAYLENEYNIGNLPLVLVGAQGGGKTTFIGNNVYDAIKAGEGCICVDIIKNCELSTAIESITPKEKLVVLDLGTEAGIQGLGYNEIIINDNMSAFQKLKLASLQSQQIMSFIDSISTGDPLSSRMRRPLNAAAQVVFCQGYNSIKNVVECLENYEKRAFYINNLKGELLEHLEDEISSLKELDERDKTGEVIGTKSSKIEHILDRIGMLREDFKMKYMYNKNLKDNINLVDCMEQGKVVLIKMREDDFPTKMIKNVMVTYWISKVWLASQIRGGLNEKPLRSNIIVDEVFQAPTCMKTLEYILPQSRKFGTKFIFSTQYVRQLDSIADVLEASGSSYMLLKGALEDDFNHLKNKIKGYEYEDLRDMEQYSSLNLIYYSKGYSSFITKLPPPLTN